jgi:hypothetical protein
VGVPVLDVVEERLVVAGRAGEVQLPERAQHDPGRVDGHRELLQVLHPGDAMHRVELILRFVQIQMGIDVPRSSH